MARPAYRNRNLQNGVTMARERIDDWMQMAKDLARAERELQIEHWVYITFEYREDDRSRVVLHKIDMPRRMLDRWRWLVEWRRAKYVCQYPRKGVQVYHCYYDKRTGLQTGFGSLLSCVAAAKAQITKVERKIEEYVSYMSGNDLFFDPTTDENCAAPKRNWRRKGPSLPNCAPCSKARSPNTGPIPVSTNCSSVFASWVNLRTSRKPVNSPKKAAKQGLSTLSATVFGIVGTNRNVSEKPEIKS